MGLVVKKTPRYVERDEKKRQAYLSQISNFKSEDIVYIDESGIDHALYRLYARSPIGERVYGDFSGKFVARTTLIAG